MRLSCVRSFAVLIVALSGSVAGATDPVVVELPEQAVARSSIVTIGDIARVSGGDAAARDRVARLDVAELKPRDPSAGVTRGVLEFRIQLAGIDPAGVVMTGADRVVVTVARRAVTAEEVVAAARAELVRWLPFPPDAATIELTRPVTVRLPEVPVGEVVTIRAQPRSPSIGPGRTQMDVTVAVGGETLLSLAVLFEVKLAGATPAPAGPAEVLVKPRQRVTMVVRLGATNVTAVGEAQQAGSLGQSVVVQNVDSKKLITGRVTGPGTVEIELGGVP